MKKVFYIAGSFVAALILMAGCSDDEAAKNKATDDDGSDSYETNNMTDDEVYTLIKEVFGEGMKVDVQPNSQDVKLTTIDQASIEQLRAVADGRIGIEEWEGLVDGFRNVSEEIGEPYVLHLMNPDDRSRKLLTVSNGTVQYDFMN